MAKKIEDNRRKNLSFFHLFMPIVILAVLSFINGSVMSFGNSIIVIVAKILVVIWSYTAIKNFIDSVYN
jgi:hypothetical protein